MGKGPEHLQDLLREEAARRTTGYRWILVGLPASGVLISLCLLALLATEGGYDVATLGVWLHQWRVVVVVCGLAVFPFCTYFGYRIAYRASLGHYGTILPIYRERLVAVLQRPRDHRALHALEATGRHAALSRKLLELLSYLFWRQAGFPWTVAHGEVLGILTIVLIWATWLQLSPIRPDMSRAEANAIAGSVIPALVAFTFAMAAVQVVPFCAMNAAAGCVLANDRELIDACQAQIEGD